jgi:hypothetical protein
MGCSIIRLSSWPALRLGNLARLAEGWPDKLPQEQPGELAGANVIEMVDIGEIATSEGRMRQVIIMP